MEKDVNGNIKKKGETLSFKILGWVSLCVAAVFFVLLFALLGMDFGSYGLAVPFGDALQFFYQNNGFSFAFYFLLIIGVMAISRRREVFAKVCFWGILIFSLLYASAFVANLYYLPQVQFTVGFEFFATYVPVLCLVIALVAILSQWEAPDKQKVNLIALVTSMISIFMTAFYCLRAAIDNGATSSIQYVNIAMVVFGAATVVLINLMVYIITRSRRIFDKVIYAMTDEEADLVEGVEDRVETVVVEFEEEMLEDIAQRMNDDSDNPSKTAEEAVEAAEEEKELEDDIEELTEAVKKPKA